jgi:hypothetical protein
MAAKETQRGVDGACVLQQRRLVHVHASRTKRHANAHTQRLERSNTSTNARSLAWAHAQRKHVSRSAANKLSQMKTGLAGSGCWPGGMIIFRPPFLLATSGCAEAGQRFDPIQA